MGDVSNLNRDESNLGRGESNLKPGAPNVSWDAPNSRAPPQGLVAPADSAAETPPSRCCLASAAADSLAGSAPRWAPTAPRWAPPCLPSELVFPPVSPAHSALRCDGRPEALAPCDVEELALSAFASRRQPVVARLRATGGEPRGLLHLTDGLMGGSEGSTGVPAGARSAFLVLADGVA